jgi:hypothetical protein
MKISHETDSRRPAAVRILVDLPQSRTHPKGRSRQRQKNAHELGIRHAQLKDETRGAETPRARLKNV